MGCSQSRQTALTEAHIRLIAEEEAERTYSQQSPSSLVVVPSLNTEEQDHDHNEEDGSSSSSSSNDEDSQSSPVPTAPPPPWRYRSSVQTKANKTCCDNFCSVLNHPMCCKHSGCSLMSYCSLCRERYQEQQQIDQRFARMLVEETMNNNNNNNNSNGEEEEDSQLLCLPCARTTNTTISEDEAAAEEEEVMMECPICLEEQQYPCALVCGHTICLEHVDKLQSCPMCRHPIVSTKDNSNNNEQEPEEDDDGEWRTATFSPNIIYIEQQESNLYDFSPIISDFPPIISSYEELRTRLWGNNNRNHDITQRQQPRAITDPSMDDPHPSRISVDEPVHTFRQIMHDEWFQSMAGGIDDL